MNSTFVKFPSTPHLALLESASVRDDKVLGHSEMQDFLAHEVIVEEKIDGANLGVSFDSNGNVLAQNRGSYVPLPSSGQWRLLEDWLKSRDDRMFETLTDRYILFGEWCYATHSVLYDQLPDWFVGFDIYDATAEKFVNFEMRNRLFDQMELQSVPFIARGHFSRAEIKSMLAKSRFGAEPSEGVYLRYDCSDWLEGRAKLVRACFIQSIEKHWSRQPLRLNRLAEENSAKSLPNECE